MGTSRPAGGPTGVRCTVIVPSFNRAGLLRDCLDSLSGGGVASEPFEVVVVDDASTDKTGQVLSAYDGYVRTVRRATNGGFSRACNDGAAVARGDLLVFLNNDARPQRGWLDALLAHADGHPQVGVVGSVLLYPDRTVQHAGVAIGLDGYPRHLYTGFPADHPVLSRPRTCQAVTAASMLVRRHLFDAVGGFDIGYRNGFEDVEFCAQIGQRGWQVQVCPESVAMHLESVSPGRFDADGANVERYRERWHGRLRPDEFEQYVADGLLWVEHDAGYPFRLRMSPYLGVVDADPTTMAGLLAARARQVHALLRALIEERVRTGALAGPATWPAVESGLEPTAGCLDTTARPISLEEHRARWLSDLEAEQRLASSRQTDGGGGDATLAYRADVARTRQVLSLLLPADAICLVISHGDAELIGPGPARYWHFPYDLDHETYAGYHPADGAAAVAHLETLIRRGGTHLAIPRAARWWLTAYPVLPQFLAQHARLILDDPASTLLYDLRGASSFALTDPWSLERVAAG